MNRYFVKLALGVVLLSVLAFWAEPVPGDPETTVEQILADKESYDGKEVSVSGTVAKLKFRTSKAGNEYTTFSLIGESGQSISVFIWKHPKLKDGQKVTVTGTYRKIKKVGRYIFYNEIEALEVKRL